ncbi:MAG: accessory factor UbiK family protein [Rhodocyclaceae bacterium]|nr:accessory factor UbiK family protein [Rhodocyclaceae bacterium]
MAVPRLLDELGSRLAELAANSPAKDVEKNVRALLSSGFSRLDLVTREEFEVQGALLERAQEKIAELEKRVASLEAAAVPGAGTD